MPINNLARVPELPKFSLSLFWDLNDPNPFPKYSKYVFFL